MVKYWISFFTAKSALAEYLVTNKEKLSFSLGESNREAIRSIFMSQFVILVLKCFLLFSAGQAIIEYFDLNQMYIIGVLFLLLNMGKNYFLTTFQCAAITAIMVFGQYIALFVFSGKFGTATYHYYGFKFNNLLLVVYFTFVIYMRHYLAVLAVSVSELMEKSKKVIKVKGFQSE